MMPTRDDLRRSVMPILRGSGVGSLLGALPGTGPSISTFLAYGWEKQIAKQPERFGNGAIEGIAAPESATNAAFQIGLPHVCTPVTTAHLVCRLLRENTTPT